jgi:hypothetical protein
VRALSISDASINEGQSEPLKIKKKNRRSFKELIREHVVNFDLFSAVNAKKYTALRLL